MTVNECRHTGSQSGHTRLADASVSHGAVINDNRTHEEFKRTLNFKEQTMDEICIVPRKGATVKCCLLSATISVHLGKSDAL